MAELTKTLKYIQFPKDPNDLLQTQRLFHGRGHAFEDLHHICIDWLPPVILITLFSAESSTNIVNLVDELVKILPDCTSVQIQRRYFLKGPIDIIKGNTITDLQILENKLKFYINLGKNRNTGLFLDMKNGREWIRENSKDMHVLNLFAYTCGFSVAAMAGGARSVLNIDMSSPVLNTGRENHRLNNQPLENVRFEKLNILKSLGRIKKLGPYDLLICDPPTFQKGSVDIIRDYPKIMRRLNQFMSADSLLMLCLNAPNICGINGREFLIEKMKVNAPDYHFVDEIKPPKVYLDVQDKGLKVLIFKNKPQLAVLKTA